MSFGSRLKSLRNEFGLTQEQLAEKINLSKANVSKYESDLIEPNLETLNMLSSLFNVSTDYILGRQNFSVPPDIEKKNNAIADIVLRLRSDAELLSIVKDVSALSPEKLQAVKTLISVIKE